MVLHVPPDLERVLKTAADRCGTDPESVALDALRQRFAPSDGMPVPQDEWESAILGLGKQRGVSLSDRDVSSEALYE